MSWIRRKTERMELFCQEQGEGLTEEEHNNLQICIKLLEKQRRSTAHHILEGKGWTETLAGEIRGYVRQ